MRCKSLPENYAESHMRPFTRREILKASAAGSLALGASQVPEASSSPAQEKGAAAAGFQETPPPFAWEHDAHHHYTAGLTGYTGLDYHSVAQLSLRPAWRAEVGQRGFYKAGMCLLPDARL